MIEQWSFVPFDVGVSLSARLDRVKLSDDWSIQSEAEVTENIVGQRVRSWTKCHDSYVYLNELGFGIYVYKSAHWPEAQVQPSIVLEILEQRRILHRTAIAGGGDLSELIRQLKEDIRNACSLRLTRPNIFGGIPYVLSIYLINAAIRKTVTQSQALLALLEPSLIDSSDDREAGTTLDNSQRLSLIKRLHWETYPDLAKDYDVSEDTNAYMSWAGVVVVFNPESLTAPHVRRLYRETEVRTQLAWSMAYYARKWCEAEQRGRRLSSDVAEQLRYNLAPIVRRAVELSDASMASRVRQILQGLDSSSGLSTQILAAQAGLADLESYIDFLRERRQRRYNRFVETALFVVASAQIIPILFPTPLIHTRHPALEVILLIVFVALICLAIIRR
jgi:hypothetical protein